MVERPRHRRRSVLGLAVAASAAIAVAALALVLSSKVLDGDEVDPCRAPSAASPAEIALMPVGLSFEQIGTVTRVQRSARQVMVQAVTAKPLDEVTVLIQDAVVAAGYRPAGMDNEGFEAEVFFTTGSGSLAAGQARVAQFGCEGRWHIDLVLVDPDAESSRTTPPSTS